MEVRPLLELADWLRVGENGEDSCIWLSPELESLVQGMEALKLLRHLTYVRARIAQEQGFLIKGMGVRVEPHLDPYTYVILLGSERFEGILYPDKLFAVLGPKSNALTGESAYLLPYHMPGLWISKEQKALADQEGVFCFQPLDFLSLDLTQRLRILAHEMIDSDDVLNNSSPTLQKELRKDDLLEKTTEVVKKLSQSGFPCPLLPSVLESTVDLLSQGRSVDACISCLEEKHAELLVQRWVHEGQLQALTLSQEWEDMLGARESRKLNVGFVVCFNKALERIKVQEEHLLLVEDPNLRESLHEGLRYSFPRITVLSRSELPPGLKIKCLTEVRFERATRDKGEGSSARGLRALISMLCDQWAQYCDLELYEARVLRLGAQSLKELLPPEIGPPRCTSINRTWRGPAGLHKLEEECPEMLEYSYRTSPVSIYLSINSFWLVFPNNHLSSPIKEMRKFLQNQLGMAFPPLRYRDHPPLPPCTYTLSLAGKFTPPTTIFRDQFFVFGSTGRVMARDPVFGEMGAWEDEPSAEKARREGSLVLSPANFVANHLRHLLVQEAEHFLGLEQVCVILDRFEDSHRELCQGLRYRFSPFTIRSIFCGLLRDRYSLSDLETISRTMLSSPGATRKQLEIRVKRALEMQFAFKSER